MGEKKAEKQFVVEFIEVYRGLPALWDVKSKDYSNRAKKGEQYDVLIEKYREKYPEAEKQDVVKKINSLRTNFRKELKRIRDAERSGAGADDVAPSLWYFEELRFLQTQETPSASINTMDISEDTTDAVDNNEDRGDANETNVHKVEECPPKREPPPRRKTEAQELITMACKRLKQPENEYDAIAQVWAMELQKMAPLQQLFAKKAINDVLFEGQMGTLHRHSVQLNAQTEYLVNSCEIQSSSPGPYIKRE